MHQVHCTVQPGVPVICVFASMVLCACVPLGFCAHVQNLIICARVLWFVFLFVQLFLFVFVCFFNYYFVFYFTGRFGGWAARRRWERRWKPGRSRGSKPRSRSTKQDRWVLHTCTPKQTYYNPLQTVLPLKIKEATLISSCLFVCDSQGVKGRGRETYNVGPNGSGCPRF